MPRNFETGYAFKEAHNTKYEKKSEAFYQNQEASLENFQNTVVEEDQVILKAELSEMTEEAKQAAYLDKYNEQIVGNKMNAKDREAKKLRKKARTMASTAKKRTAELYKKIDQKASEIAQASGLNMENITLERLNSYKLTKAQIKADPKIKKNFETLKKQAPPIYQRYCKMENLYIDMINADTKNNDLLQLVYKQLQDASMEWQHVKEKIDSICITQPIISEERKQQFENEREHLDNNPVFSHLSISKDDQKKLKHDYEKEKSEGYYEKEIKNSLKKHTIDWNKNDDTIRKEMESLKATIDNKQKEFDSEKDQKEAEKKEREIAYLRKDLHDYEIEMFVRKSVNKIVETEQVTPQKVEERITRYLKKIAENAEFRFRANEEVSYMIMQNRSICGGSDDYKQMNSSMYMPFSSKKMDYSLRGNLTYGYLGGKNEKEFVGLGNEVKDQVDMYGHVSLKLNKEKMKNRTAFVVGNSLHNYDVLSGRSIDDPDLLAVGENFDSVYKRAKELEENGWKMDSAEQEARRVVTSDGGRMRYFEAHYLGRVSAREIDEVTYTYRGAFPNIERLKGELAENAELKKLYELIQVINEIPQKYGRDKNDPKIKMTVWDANGNALSSGDLDYIFNSDN